MKNPGAARPAPTIPKTLAELVGADEDLRLTLGYVAPPDRMRVAAVFALALELRRVPEVVKEPPIGEIRLQWWRERLAELAAGEPPRVGHPTLEALAAAAIVTQATLPALEAAIDARAEFLYPEPFETHDAFWSTLERAEAVLLLAAPDATPDAFMGEVRDRIGRYAAARWRARLAPALGAKLRDALLENARSHAPIVVPDNLDPASLLFVALTKGYLKREPGVSWGLAKRLALFRAMALGRL
ncbi:MAG: squalene/phytoene synthase family protein [Pseudomonadota bacterium]